NRPRHAEEVAVALAAAEPVSASAMLLEAQRAIADHVHPKYRLIEARSRGVVFHHGSMPEMIRMYVEQLYSDLDAAAPKYMVSTSTLLEGVNTPSDTLFVLNPVKGRNSYLSPSQFRNLAGRIGRFSEIFAI